MRRVIFRLSIGTLTFGLGISIAAWFFPSHSQVSTPSKVDVPHGWKKVELSDFSFYVPPDMKERDVRGIDSEVREYRNRNMRLGIDYGMYSNDLKSYAARPEYKSESVSIDGEKAKVATYRSSKS